MHPDDVTFADIAALMDVGRIAIGSATPLSRDLVCELAQPKNGQYQFHYLYALCTWMLARRGHCQVLAWGAHADHQIVGAMCAGADVAAILMPRNDGVDEQVFRQVCQRFRVPRPATEFGDLESFLRNPPKLDIVFLGYYADHNSFWRLKPLLNPGCIVLVDRFTSRGMRLVDYSQFAIYWTYYSAYPYESLRKSRFSADTWGEGLAVAIIGPTEETAEEVAEEVADAVDAQSTE